MYVYKDMCEAMIKPLFVKYLHYISAYEVLIFTIWLAEKM